jgi:Kef-type K+ transport system membrane component KefB
VSQLLRLVLIPLRQPAVVAYILAGFLLGPSVLGALPSDPSAFLFPPEVRSGLSVIGSIGLVLFAFLIGLELDLDAVRRQSRRVLEVSASALLLPLAVGAGLALALYPRHADVAGTEVSRTAFVLFIATAMAVTAFPVLVAIVSERGMRDSPLGRLAIGSAAIQDAVGWVLLAAALAAASGGGSDLPRVVAETVAFIVALVLVRPLLRAALRRIGDRRDAGTGSLALALGFAIACAGATQAIGLHLVVGAFAAGLAFPRDTREAPVSSLVGPTMPLTIALLMPIYFLGPGLGVDIGAIDGRGFVELAAIVVLGCGSKLLGGGLAARLSGMGWAEAGALGVLLNTRGLMELVVLSVGYAEGVLDRALYSELVIMALVTTLMTGPLLDRFGPTLTTRR